MKRRKAKNIKIGDVLYADSEAKKVVGKMHGVAGLLIAPQLMEFYFENNRVTVHEDYVFDVLTKKEKYAWENRIL